MKKRTIAMFLSVALCLSVALTGCGADKSQQSNPSDDGKKSLTIAVLNDVVSLDPAVKDSGIEMQMASHLYRCPFCNLLFRINHLICTIA